jgi:NAD(P)-dependent dehydrogenase (short-subunit alcohol dehydrogenase family)
MERRLLVLGGASGIGEAFVQRARELPSAWDQIYAPDIAELDVIRIEPMLEAVRKYQPTDVVYSVGVNNLDWMRDASKLAFTHLMETNVWGFFNLIRALDHYGPHPSNVVAVTSDAAWRPMRTSAIYCASKAALEMAVRVASREYAPAGWRINAVAPGKVEHTPMTDYVDQRVLELRGWSTAAAEAYEVASTPLGRKVTKEEVAQVIEHVLFGPKAQTGEIVAVNGGR